MSVRYRLSSRYRQFNFAQFDLESGTSLTGEQYIDIVYPPETFRLRFRAYEVHSVFPFDHVKAQLAEFQASDRPINVVVNDYDFVVLIRDRETMSPLFESTCAKFSAKLKQE